LTLRHQVRSQYCLVLLDVWFCLRNSVTIFFYIMYRKFLIYFVTYIFWLLLTTWIFIIDLDCESLRERRERKRAMNFYPSLNFSFPFLFPIAKKDFFNRSFNWRAILFPLIQVFHPSRISHRYDIMYNFLRLRFVLHCIFFIVYFYCVLYI